VSRSTTQHAQDGVDRAGATLFARLRGRHVVPEDLRELALFETFSEAQGADRQVDVDRGETLAEHVLRRSAPVELGVNDRAYRA
jgi:hypothetical protein